MFVQTSVYFQLVQSHDNTCLNSVTSESPISAVLILYVSTQLSVISCYG